MFKNISCFLPTFGQCWIIVFLIVVAGSLLGLPFLLISGNALVSYVIPFLPAFIYVLIKGRAAGRKPDAPCVPLDRKIRSSMPALCAVAFLLALATLLLSVIILEPFSSLVEIPDYLIDNLYGAILEDPLWNVLSVVIAAPLLEEFFIRGIMLRGMLQRMSAAKAITWSAFIFALIHLNLYQALGAFVIGLFIGWVYYRSGSLLFAILIHFVNNSFSAAMLFLFPEMELDTTLLEIVSENFGILSYILLYILSAALFVTIIRILNRFFNNAKKEKEVISA